MFSVDKSQRNSQGRNVRIMVAVDFGTTFTSVAYSSTSSPERHKLLNKWGDGGHETRNSVPTVLRYDNGGTTGAYVWGFRAKQLVNRGEKIHEWFKLGLCNDFEKRRARESELMRKYQSSAAIQPVRCKECETLVVNFLSSIKESVDKFFDETYQDMHRVPRDYIITIPALWDHAEQEKTRQCAERAGMGEGSQLQVISEPEAASIYAIHTRFLLQVNETFVLCDAGGGTVDLSSHTIESLSMSPFHCKLAEAAAGSGGLCGSSFLNRIFEKYLQRKFKDYPEWEPSFTIDALNEFEERTKRDFTGEGNEEYNIRIPGLVLSERHGIYNRNVLTLTTRELRKNIFDEVVFKVQGLVRDQIANTNGTVKAVLLAGGFGQNHYLQKKLKEIDIVVKDKIRVEQIDNCDTAIARGALIAGLAGMGRTNEYTDDGGFNALPTAIKVGSRIAGRHYGTVAYQDFEEGVDPEDRKVIRDDGAKIERIQWFVNTGDRILDGQPMSFKFCKVAKVRPGTPAHTACFVAIKIYTSEKKIPVDYKEHDTVWKIAEFEFDLRGLVIPTIWVNGTEFYSAYFSIEMTLHAASLSFCAVYGKGTPDAKRFPAKQVQFL
ncbi:hypothetical protein UA08_00165 [Talaromyces atroroseus]|uniref:Uncharacterized protein n=1 Tax=Talaromyces atroroseus TaxID=1441469 RepID=A0A225AR33_TALAT|nr:hypothetical protein UA08_00165 [Talaromyces atroroseus]OKL64061.1 hypothetical protein UA08_00165 [Talaromyces atroroseus]